MSKHIRNILGAVAVLGILAGAGALYADDDTSKNAKPTVTVPSGKKVPKLKAKDMKTNARKSIGKMQNTLKHAVKRQTVARSQKDVIKLNCVNNKLLQVKQLMNIADKAFTDMIEAIEGSDLDTAHGKYVTIIVSGDKVWTLHQETDGCIGAEITFLGPTKVDVKKPLIIDDPTKKDAFSIVFNDGIVDGTRVLKIERAVYGTPFR